MISAPQTTREPHIPSSRSGALVAIAAVSLATIVGAWLRFWHISARSFWVDEGASWAIARLDWWNFARLLWRREANMSLYYLLLRGWLLFGASESWIRALSAIFGIATIPLIYFVGTKLWNRGVGLVAAILMAINAYTVRYSQEARAYSLAVFLVLLSTYALILLLERVTPKRRLLYITASALAVYAHFYSLLVLAAQWLWTRKLAPDDSPQPINRAQRWILIALIPVLLFVITTGAGPLAWLSRPGWRELWQLFVFLSGGQGSALALVMLVLALVNTVVAFQAPDKKNRNAVLLCLWWLVFPVVLIFVLSWIKPLFMYRFLIVCLPALSLLAASAVTQLRPWIVSFLAMTVVVALSIVGLQKQFTYGLDQPNEDWRGATAYVLQQSRSEDGAIFYSSQCRMPFDFYASGATNRPSILFPSHGPQLTYQDFMGKPSPELLSGTRPIRPQRMWLVLCHNLVGNSVDANTRSILATVEQNYIRADSAVFPGVQVNLYALKR